MLNKRGFTIIEITIVMAFVSVLVLAVVLATVYTGKMYAKGVTLKSLNQVGRDVSDAMRRDMTDANPKRVMYVATGTAPLQTGRLCLGSVSYVWNTADLMLSASTNPRFKKADGNEAHLVRVVDPSSRYCVDTGSGYPMEIATTESATEYLIGNSSDLAVYRFSLTPIYRSGDDTVAQGLFRIGLTIGTNEAGTTDMTDGTVTCKAPSDNAANFDFCSVRDFDFVMRAGGGK